MEKFPWQQRPSQLASLRSLPFGLMTISGSRTLNARKPHQRSVIRDSVCRCRYGNIDKRRDKIHLRCPESKHVYWFVTISSIAREWVKRPGCPSSGNKCREEEAGEEKRRRQGYDGRSATVVGVLLQAQNRK